MGSRLNRPEAKQRIEAKNFAASQVIGSPDLSQINFNVANRIQRYSPRIVISIKQTLNER